MYRQNYFKRFFAPVDIASIAIFRIAFGLILLWEVIRYFQYGWIREFFVDPQFHFSYYGFDWVKPLPGNGMIILFIILGILALCIALGFCYRFSVVLFFVGFTYLFLAEEARWLNHFYLVILLSFLLTFIPAHRAYSIDAWLRPSTRLRTVPALALWVLRAQLGLVYFFGAIAKLNPDWLHGQPMQMWLVTHADFPVIGPLFTQSWTGLFFSYGGLLFDLLFVPFILWRRTRLFALVVALFFHLMNSQLFDIGIFPWLMIAALVLFLPPTWPRRVIERLWPTTLTEPSAQYDFMPNRRYVIAAVALYFGVQLVIPLRHYLYPGDVNWTQQGDRFSWRMKLLDLQGDATFIVTDPAQQDIWEVNPSDYLADWQIHEMIQRPDMTLQFSHYLADVFRQQGHTQIEVRAQVMVSLNGRPPQLMIDPDIDLAAQSRTLTATPWLLPNTSVEN